MRLCQNIIFQRRQSLRVSLSCGACDVVRGACGGSKFVERREHS
ncbi:hypothetical protein LINPERPRIM_LOCUS34222 [Linum perenne]